MVPSADKVERGTNKEKQKKKRRRESNEGIPQQAQGQKGERKEKENTPRKREMCTEGDKRERIETGVLGSVREIN